MSTAEERISELEEKSLEIMQTDTQEKKSEEDRTLHPRAVGQYQMVQHTFN